MSKLMSELMCEFWILNPALATKSILTSRPWQSQGLLYKHLCHSLIHWFINWLTDPLVEIYLRCRHAQMVTNCASSHKTNYIDIFFILNLEGHLNRCIGSKVTAILDVFCLLVELHWEGSALQPAQQASFHILTF